MGDETVGPDTSNPETRVPELGRINVGLQIAAAIGLVAVALGAMWGLGTFRKAQDGSADAGKPAVCQPPKAEDGAEYPALCAALNRADLPTLLGVPGEHISLAHSAGSTFTAADGTKQTEAAAEIQLGSYNLQLIDHQSISVTDLVGLTLSAEPTSVLGHPAASYSDHTIEISFTGGQSGGSSGPGGIARHLVVAKTGKRDGSCLELAVWRQDGGTPDTAALLRIAEKVLPAAPGWATGS